MDVDIDSFIREQKSKIATERQYLSNQNLSTKTLDYKVRDNSDKNNLDNFDNFVLKMKEGENMKNKYKQELRNDYANVKEFNKHVELSSRREKANEKTDHDGLLPGLGYSNSASKKKELIRNHEYNEFKKIEEENFKNRFQNKKISTRKEINNSHLTRNPIVPENPPFQRNRSLSPPINKPNENRNKLFENELDVLEKKVDELRKIRIQQIDFTNQNPINLFNIGQETNYLPIKASKSLRSLDETDKKLREIDEKYDESRNRFLKNRRIGNHRKIDFILDDEKILGNQTFQRPLSDIGIRDNQMMNSEPSIIPIGRIDEESKKRLKQQQYRKDLENQMKEKSINHKRLANSISNENISFIDRFGQNSKSIVNKVESARADISLPDQDSEYFYYASRNPLDEFETNSYVPSSFQISEPSKNSIQNMNQHLKTSIKIGQGNESNKNYKENYAEELKKQIEERKIRKEIDKRRLDEYEKRKNEEIMNYDPFGRGGGGAPLKDNRGEVIADLKNMKFDTKITIPPTSIRPNVDYFKEPEKPIISSDPNELKTYARGGHGIFGQALSDEDKNKAEKYKEELKIQIELKKRQKEIEKENERIRESKEREKFEKEQKLIQLELENEKKLQRQKELEHHQKLEDNRLAAQEMKKNKERVESKPEEPSSSSVLYRIRENSISKSPPIVRNRTPLENKNRTPTEIKRNKTPNEEMTNNFYSLKAKLGQEMALLEKEIAHQKDEVEIYDPRLGKNIHLDKQIENVPFDSDMVFDAVLQKKGPMSVRRGYFKPKRNRENSAINTEMDLDEHLKQQEKVLHRMHQNNFSQFELNMPDLNPSDLSIRPSSQMSNQLESDTKFIEFQQSRDFNNKSSLSSVPNYDYFTPMTPKPLKKNPEFGSNTSLDIDEITRKNQQRLRKLQKIQIENEKSQTTDEILNKFLVSQDI